MKVQKSALKLTGFNFHVRPFFLSSRVKIQATIFHLISCTMKMIRRGRRTVLSLQFPLPKAMKSDHIAAAASWMDFRAGDNNLVFAADANESNDYQLPQHRKCNEEREKFPFKTAALMRMHLQTNHKKTFKLWDFGWNILLQKTFNCVRTITD